MVALGSRVFVSSFQLAGVQGIKVDTASQAYTEIERLRNDVEIGLVLISDDIGKELRLKLAEMRSKKPIPLIFELPAPNSIKKSVDYRALLKQILGV